jgi:DNA-binding NtrC family response regulator
MTTDTDTETTWESRDTAMQEVLNTARIVAATQVNTLLLGEHGSGKQFLARAIHAHSPRSGAPFVTVNCATLPPDRAEQLLFGNCGTHANGNDAAAAAYIQAAAGGTLFLEDVSALSPAAQTALLHLLERGEIIPHGAALPVSVDVRIIAASHHDLTQAVAEGGFHPDLFYQLHVVPLTLPPLRKRPRDITNLARRLLSELAARHDVEPAQLDRSAQQLLLGYSWPGNVRELRNLCERLTLLLPGRKITGDNLPGEFRHPGGTIAGTVALPSTGLNLAELEKDLIAQALERTGGNRSRAARLLGLTRDTLLYRLKKFALR